MKKILLLGATGLIGSRVYEKLRESYSIIRIGRREECELQVDLSNIDGLEESFFEDVFAVVHCAGVTDEDFRERHAEAFLRSSLGIERLAQLAIKREVKKFLYVSTSHVYGAQKGTIDENTTANPLSDYAISHYVAEQTLQRNSDGFEDVWIIRPNAVFGEPVLIDAFRRWNLIPYSFPLEAVYSKKIVLRSSGEQHRNFVGTQDIANYVEDLLSRSQKDRFSIVNPLGRDSISVYDFALKCAEIYKNISGNECSVERPAYEELWKEEAFSYSSQFDIAFERADLDKSLENLIYRIVEDFENGKKYEA